MSATRGPAVRGRALLGGLVLAAGLLAGCGSDDGGSAAAPATTDPSLGTVTLAEDGVQEVTIQTPDEYVWLPETFTVAPGRVRLTVESTATEATHNFRFTPGAGAEEISEEVPLLAAGESRTIEFEVTVPGEHPYECSFHVQLGQTGVMTVSG